MNLVIIPADSTVIKNSVAISGLDLTPCNIPADVHALQWQDTSGWIEYIGADVPNEDITVLPDWANACLAVWQTAYDAIPAPTDPEIVKAENAKRLNSALKASDWSQLADVPLANRSDWVAYRAAIRNMAVNPPSDHLVMPSELPAEPPVIYTT
jgi:hypothetical protein